MNARPDLLPGAHLRQVSEDAEISASSAAFELRHLRLRLQLALLHIEFGEDALRDGRINADGALRLLEEAVAYLGFGEGA